MLYVALKVRTVHTRMLYAVQFLRVCVFVGPENLRLSGQKIRYARYFDTLKCPWEEGHWRRT